MAVDNPHRIIGVQSGNQGVSSFFNGYHVSRSDIAGSTDKSEVFHHGYRVNCVGKLGVANKCIRLHLFKEVPADLPWGLVALWRAAWPGSGTLCAMLRSDRKHPGTGSPTSGLHRPFPIPIPIAPRPACCIRNGGHMGRGRVGKRFFEVADSDGVIALTWDVLPRTTIL